jgi:oleandomycin transport system ATP-binding protein
VRRLDELGVEIEDVGVRESSLDDVFFALTGHGLDEGASDDEPARDDGTERLDDGAGDGQDEDGRDADAEDVEVAS